MSSPESNHVLIIGAGVGGLALAQGLKKHGIKVTIFERDLNSVHRAQGYRIKIFPDTVADLKYLLSPEVWNDFESTCAETGMGESVLNAIDAHFIARRATKGGPRPYTADRGVLRVVLTKGLHEELQWGKTFTRYELEGDKVRAHFEDGSSVLGTLLVGADGLRSPVRKQYLPNHKHVDVQGCSIYGKTPLDYKLLETFPGKALSWMTWIKDSTPPVQEIIFGDTPVIAVVEAMKFPKDASRDYIPADYVYWAMIFHKRALAPNDAILEQVLKRPAKDLALSLTSEWDPSLRRLFELQDESQTTAIRVISTDPNIESWSPSAQVTLLGDAVHVMSPAGGVGAITALKDAASLVKVLVADGISSESIGEYETAMKEYAAASLSRSIRGGEKLYNQPPIELCPSIKI